jgi:peptidoglycan/LPS O-acetylase OafA/YrhL
MGLFFDVLVWWSIGVAMPVFFTLSGFFAVRIYDSRGLLGFVHDRGRRIVGPLLDGGAVVLPLSLAGWGAGWLASGRCSWHELLLLDFADADLRDNHWGPAHLWFLEYLVLMLAAYAGARALFQGLRTGVEGWLGRTLILPSLASLRLGRILLSPLAPILLALPTTWFLFEGHRQSGLDAVLSMRNSFDPDPFRWSHHAWFFAVGVWLSRHRRDLSRLTAPSGWLFGLSLPVFALRAELLARDLKAPLVGPEAVALAVTGALFAWLSLFGLLGLCHHWFRHSRPAVRYLADSSYWIYLVHFPLVGILQVTLVCVPIAPLGKFAAVLTVTLALCLLSYQRLVRHSQIGLWLHGPRHTTPPTVLVDGHPHILRSPDSVPRRRSHLRG